MSTLAHEAGKGPMKSPREVTRLVLLRLVLDVPIIRKLMWALGGERAQCSVAMRKVKFCARQVRRKIVCMQQTLITSFLFISVSPPSSIITLPFNVQWSMSTTEKTLIPMPQSFSVCDPCPW